MTSGLEPLNFAFLRPDLAPLVPLSPKGLESDTLLPLRATDVRYPESDVAALSSRVAALELVENRPVDSGRRNRAVPSIFAGEAFGSVDMDLRLGDDLLANGMIFFLCKALTGIALRTGSDFG